MRTLRFFLAGIVIAYAAMPMAAHAQNYPDRPIRIVVPYPPGAANDAVGRIIATGLEARLGQPVIVENRDGGASSIGTNFVAKAKPDGYTLLLNAVDVFTLFPLVRPSLPFVAPRDFTFISRVASVPYAIHVNADRPYRTLKELIAFAKANPNAIRYGSSGPGSLPHVAMVMFADEAGIKMLHVPYRGMAAVTNDVVAGHIDAAVVSPSTMAPFVASGKVRTLALTSPVKSARWPEIPTTLEGGISNIEADLVFALVGPAGMDPAITTRLSKAMEALLKEPEPLKKLSDRGLTATYMDTDQITTYVTRDIAKWRPVVEKYRKNFSE